MDVVILAGGRCDDELRAASGAEFRADIEVCGRTLARTVLDAARPLAEPILVGGPEGLSQRQAAAGDDFCGSLRNGLEQVKTDKFLLVTVDLPCMIELAGTRGVPIAGKDFKTGQTLIKTMLAPGFKARMLGLRGWYSTNILGNRDGEVLDDPENFKSKEVSKLGVLDTILQPEVYPDLYGEIDHVVRINYYPPRGDNKEGWDAIDIFGWLGYPMQIKVNFMCRDSILAAPIVLDLALFMDLASRAGESGVQEWLSFYLKAPQAATDVPAEHDLFIQQTKFKNTLREWMGEEPVTHSEAG